MADTTWKLPATNDRTTSSSLVATTNQLHASSVANDAWTAVPHSNGLRASSAFHLPAADAASTPNPNPNPSIAASLQQYSSSDTAARSIAVSDDHNSSTLSVIADRCGSIRKPAAQKRPRSPSDDDAQRRKYPSSSSSTSTSHGHQRAPPAFNNAEMPGGDQSAVSTTSRRRQLFSPDGDNRRPLLRDESSSDHRRLCHDYLPPSASDGSKSLELLAAAWQDVNAGTTGIKPYSKHRSAH